jgi:hypothetical protein
MIIKMRFKKLIIIGLTAGYLKILKESDWPRPEDGCLV